MKKLLFIGLSYHLKSKSDNFLLDILNKEYQVQEVHVSSFNDVALLTFEEEFDYLVMFQVLPYRELLNGIKFKKGIFFPMYDTAIRTTDEEWNAYKDFCIISFCKTLHNKLISMGMQSHYIQYFPKVGSEPKWGNEKSLFFWQRVKQIDINHVLKVCKELSLERLHVHKVLDSGHYFNDLKEEASCEITFSDWFENKEELYDLIEESSFYFAPRKWEGIGMSFLEAMAQGRCVIAINNPTMNEYIENGVTGLLYDFNNPNLLERFSVRELQKNAYEYMKKGYTTWENEKYKIIEWIESAPIIKEKRKVEIKVDYLNERKFRLYFHMMNKWLMLKHKNIRIDEYLKKYGYNQIALYGGGQIAERLLEELENSTVNVKYIIDENPIAVKICLPTIHMGEQLPLVDAIVVTPCYLFEELKEKLSSYIDVPIISLDKMMEELLK